MTRFVFIVATLLGAAAIVWMGSTFVGTNALALVVTATIGAGFLLGMTELTQFRRDTARLAQKLKALGDSAENSPAGWASQLPGSLQHAVQLRLEGERVALPSPVFTPYLVGLLVMLGLLGTFVGMVDTLQGAVIALQGNTELDAIRNGLAAPIEGLSVAFGTSVAGVAASAMLGLNSTLSRRERMLAARLLDQKARTVFYEFSDSYQRQHAYQAMQDQARALPGVAASLQQLVTSLDGMGTGLASTLTEGQSQFHETTRLAYEDLGKTVQQSLHEGLVKSAEATQQIVAGAAKQQLADIGEQVSASLQSLSAALLQVDTERRENWQTSLEELQSIATTQLVEAAGAYTNEMRQLGEMQQAGLQAAVAEFQSLALAQGEQWRQTAEQVLVFQERLNALSQLMEQNSADQRGAVEALVSGSTELLQQVGGDFSKQVSTETERLSLAADSFSGSAVEMLSLGDAFSLAMKVYSDSNRELVETLGRIEAALDSSTARSDEQMGYYVAQAREIIDQSMLSQQELVEELRQLAPAVAAS